jgi:very-short-patch-repair endonuclease
MRTTPKTLGFARRLRRTMTLPEVLLWQALRRHAYGLSARRQHPIGRYIADFYVPSARLVVEIDGAGHDAADKPQRDTVRDMWFREQGYDVVRIRARDVLVDVDAALRTIAAAAGLSPPTGEL